MRPIKLTKRLAAAARLVRENRPVADVGCDHGKLCAFLIQSGKTSRVIGTDIHMQPLQKAQTLFAVCGITDRAQTVLCDGLSGITPKDADDIVIAGLGADTAMRILAEAPWLHDADKHLVLVPASHHERLRRWLCENGFAIEQEIAVSEGGHCYTAMSAYYAGQTREPDPVYCALGKIKPDSDAAIAYIKKEYKKALRLVEAHVGEKKQSEALEIVQYIEEELQIHG